MKKSTPTPHDAVFRQLLSQPEVARDFMEIYLPPQLLALCDLSTLRLASGSFVEDDLRPYFSDVLYSMKTRSGGAFFCKLAQHMPQHEVPLMTIAEQLRQEGRIEGELRGKLEGKLEGELKGKLEVARNLLKMQLPRETILRATGLTEDELNRIQPG